MINRVLRGVVHGNTIRLRDDAGVADGEEVEVVLRRLLATDGKSGEGFRLTEGALADGSEWDAAMEAIHAARKQE